MEKPNLYDFATSELSQDAFIAWLLSWSHPDHENTDRELHRCGLSLLHAFFETCGLTPPTRIEKVTCRTQQKHVDVRCLVNDSYVVLVEDKIGTSEHSNQLKRYREAVIKEGYDKDHIVAIYYKTEDQSNLKRVSDAGFSHFDRKAMLSVLEKYSGNNDILTDFRERLSRISAAYQSYLSKPVDEWGVYAWQGFFSELQARLETGQWGYVPNAQKGFWAFYFGQQSNGKQDLYLQIEASPPSRQLAIKIWVGHGIERNQFRSIRDTFARRVRRSASETEVPVRKPRRYGHGTHMTLAVLDGDFPHTDDAGLLDMNKTIDDLKKFQNLVKHSMKED